MLLLIKTDSAKHDNKVRMSDTLGRVQIVGLCLNDLMKNESSSKILVEEKAGPGTNFFFWTMA